MRVRFFVLIAAPTPHLLSHPGFSYCACAASYTALVAAASFMESQTNRQPSIIRNVYTDYTHLTAELWPTFFSLKDNILHQAHLLLTKGCLGGRLAAPFKGDATHSQFIFDCQRSGTLIDPYSFSNKFDMVSSLAETCIRGLCYIDLHPLFHATNSRLPKLIPIVFPTMRRMLIHPTSNPSGILVEPIVPTFCPHNLGKLEECTDTQSLPAAQACKAHGTAAYIP